ncbi:heavy-metal-associated domain-containing protein [Nocardia salmonicida]
MTCSCCANSVNKEVGKIAGVTAVEADFASGRVTVDAAGVVDRSAIAAAVARLAISLRNDRTLDLITCSQIHPSTDRSQRWPPRPNRLTGSSCRSVA